VSGCLWALLGGTLFSGAANSAVRASGRELQRRFIALGVMTGKTKAEIVAAVGPPSSISQLPDGKMLLQWIASGYHIALRFDGEKFDGVTHEFAS
jgi:hypothetical protein